VVTIGNDGATMAGLGKALAVAYAGAMPRLTDACAQLESLGLGVSVVHGDFHPWNVAAHDNGCVVFDWSDAAIGHPFMDLIPYILHSRDIGLRRAMVGAYLACWADVASPERLREAVRLALPLGCLYQVVSYRGLFAGLNPDDRADMHGADIDWLEQTLLVLDQGIEAPRREPI
jgi:Ser/Thr protein kinase RdoA (MazF antagonist)